METFQQDKQQDNESAKHQPKVQNQQIEQQPEIEHVLDSSNESQSEKAKPKQKHKPSKKPQKDSRGTSKKRSKHNWKHCLKNGCMVRRNQKFDEHNKACHDGKDYFEACDGDPCSQCQPGLYSKLQTKNPVAETDLEQNQAPKIEIRKLICVCTAKYGAVKALRKHAKKAKGKCKEFFEENLGKIDQHEEASMYSNLASGRMTFDRAYLLISQWHKKKAAEFNGESVEENEDDEAYRQDYLSESDEGIPKQLSSTHSKSKESLQEQDQEHEENHEVIKSQFSDTLKIKSQISSINPKKRLKQTESPIIDSESDSENKQNMKRIEYYKTQNKKQKVELDQKKAQEKKLKYIYEELKFAEEINQQVTSENQPEIDRTDAKISYYRHKISGITNTRENATINELEMSANAFRSSLNEIAYDDCDGSTIQKLTMMEPYIHNHIDEVKDTVRIVEDKMETYKSKMTKYQSAVSALTALTINLPGVKVKVRKSQNRLIVKAGPAKGKTRMIIATILYLAEEWKRKVQKKYQQLKIAVVYTQDFLKDQDTAQYKEVTNLMKNCGVEFDRFCSFADAKTFIDESTVVFFDEFDYKIIDQVDEDPVDVINLSCLAMVAYTATTPSVSGQQFLTQIFNRIGLHSVIPEAQAIKEIDKTMFVQVQDVQTFLDQRRGTSILILADAGDVQDLKSRIFEKTNYQVYVNNTEPEIVRKMENKALIFTDEKFMRGLDTCHSEQFRLRNENFACIDLLVTKVVSSMSALIQVGGRPGRYKEQATRQTTLQPIVDSTQYMNKIRAFDDKISEQIQTQIVLQKQAKLQTDQDKKEKQQKKEEQKKAKEQQKLAKEEQKKQKKLQQLQKTDEKQSLLQFLKQSEKQLGEQSVVQAEPEKPYQKSAKEPIKIERSKNQLQDPLEEKADGEGGKNNIQQSFPSNAQPNSKEPQKQQDSNQEEQKSSE